MKKYTRILMSLLISVSLFSLTPSFSSIKAEEQPAYTIEEINGRDQIVDTFGKTHELYYANGEKVPLEYALSVLNNDALIETNNSVSTRFMPLRSPIAPDTVSLNSKSSYYAGRVRVTPYVKGPATITYGQSSTVSESFGGNISISASVKGMIIAQAGAQFGVTWNSTASSSSTFSTSFSIPSGKTGAVYFRAKMIRVSGSYYDSKLKAYYVYGDTPAKLGSFADGIYEAVY